MSHFTVLVLGKDIDEALAPYDEALQVVKKVEADFSYWSNPRAKWDWWVVGGRWEDFFLLNDGTRCDQAVFKEINWEGMRKENRFKAKMRYRKMAKLCGGEIPKIEKSWEQIKQENPKEEIAKLRLIYQTQPSLIKWNKCLKNEYARLENFQTTEEEYSQMAYDNLKIHAILDDDWHESGSMGWWGVVAEKKENDAWNLEVANLLKTISPNMIVTLIDCHI